METNIKKLTNAIHFNMILDQEINETEARQFQASHGYMPAGYGFYSFTCKQVDGKFQVSWFCNSSCD